MKLTTLQPVYDAEGPFTTVCLDVSRTEAESAHQLELRWRAVRERLDDASDQTVDLLESQLLSRPGSAASSPGSWWSRVTGRSCSTSCTGTRCLATTRTSAPSRT